MPLIKIISKLSKNPATRTSTRRVLKTVRAQQAELESEDDSEDPAEAILVNDEEEAAFKRREEEEESEKDKEDEDKDADEDHGDEDSEEQDDDASDNEDEDERPASVQVIPQKRKNGKDNTGRKPTSKPFSTIRFSSTFSKLSSLVERVNRLVEENVVTRKITYNLTIFSLAELAKPSAHREPAARFFVLPSNLEWPDIYAQLKIKAGDFLYAGQAAIHDDAYEMSFCIARHVSNPLPLSCVADYEHLVENALRQQQPTVKVIIKATVRSRNSVYVQWHPLTNIFRELWRKRMYLRHLSQVPSTFPIKEGFNL